MAIRDFSQEKYNNLVDALDDIKSKQHDKFTEIGEDYLFKAARHLGRYDPDKIVEKKIDHYQKNMMDAYNTTKTDLTDIFDSVQEIDEKYGVVFEEIAESFSQVRQSIQSLMDHTDHIDDASALQALKAKLSVINKKLDLADAKVTKSFDKALDYQMTYLKHESAKGMYKGRIKLLGDVFSFCGSAIKGDAVGVVDKLWTTCNDFIDLCSDTSVYANAVATTTAIGLIKGGSWLGGKFGLDPIDFQYQDFKNRQIQYMTEELEKEDGVSGQFKSTSDDPENNPLYQITKGFDTVQDIYGLVDGIKDFAGNIKEGKLLPDFIEDTRNPSLDSFFSWDPSSGTPYQSFSIEQIDRYQKLKRYNSVLKIFNSGVSSVTDQEPDPLLGFVKDQMKDYTYTGSVVGFFEDGKDIVEEIIDFFDGGFGD